MSHKRALTYVSYCIVTIECRLQHTGNAKLRCTFWIYNHYLVCATGQRPCSDTQVNVRSAWREKNWKLLDVGLSVLLCCISVRISFCKGKQCLSALLWNKSIYLTIKSIYAFILCPTVIVKTRVISILCDFIICCHRFYCLFKNHSVVFFSSFVLKLTCSSSRVAHGKFK